MIKRISSLIVLCVLCSGCAIHFQNEKGINVNAQAKDIQTKMAQIEKAKGKSHYWSRLDVWIPWRPKDVSNKED